jgi:hypothetical protein
MNSNITRLNRFTTLPVLLDFLERKKLVLLDPKSWDDKNDTEVILAYKEKKGIEKLFALCFTHDYETIHHWKTFANGSSGCCIEFDADKLIQIFKKAKLRHGIVEYKKIKEATPNSFKIHQMPFIKRKPYECEQEYRIIWEGDTDTNVFELDVPLDTINKITISQQMPEQVFITIKNLLKKTFDDPEKRISRSTIYENQRWINSFKKYDLS